MALTIGQQLRAAREDKGLSIEDLAHKTRIHSNFVRALESDDYSGFASITYAKSFLQLYSRHLDIDASEALSVFKGNNAVNLHGNSLLSDSHESIEPMGSAMNSRSVKRKRRTEKPGGAPIFLGMILGVLLIAIPTFYFLGYNAE
ncbi:helix-turn-helix domain-containing protein, partial [bacterium]|nr:helix-turn-helix domain-containing protein [bacterium]